MLANLYPPLVETYPPAFIQNQDCIIYFDFNSLTSYSSSLTVDIKVKDNKTNKSVLKDKLETINKNINVDEDKYSIIISNADLESPFKNNQYYQVQLRLRNSDGSLSEWSTACLIKPIAQPIFKISNLTESTSKSKSIKGFFDLPTIIGTLSFVDSDGNVTEESEALLNYCIKLYHIEKINGNDTIVYDIDDDISYTDYSSPLSFTYFTHCDFEPGIEYTLEVTYTTTNLFSETKKYYFNIYQTSEIITDFNFNGDIVANEELGCLEIPFIIGDKFKNISLMRAKIEDNKRWEEIQIFPISADFIQEHGNNFIYKDYTVESGYRYSYKFREIDSYGAYSASSMEKISPVINFEHSYLFKDGIQLCIKYNPNITGYKKNIQENLTETLGSKYPLVRRKGLTGYVSFTLTGTIESSMDYFSLYTNNTKSDSTMSGINSNESITHTFLNTNFTKDNFGLTSFQDERIFRDAVINFLSENNIKLFKSPTEGNLLVKINNISFTPNQTLGRKIWDFSATLTEIDDCTFSNYLKYGIITKNNAIDYFNSITREHGQCAGIFRNNENIFDYISKYKELYTDGNLNYKRNVKYLTSFHLEIDTELYRPYLIDTINKIPLSNPASDTIFNLSHILLGYLIEVNDNKIIIPPSGLYDFESNMNIGIDNIRIILPTENYPQLIDLVLNYTVVFYDNQIQKKQVSEIYVEKCLGQYIDTFYPSNVNLYDAIYGRRYYDFEDYADKFTNIVVALIEGEPGTLVELKDGSDLNYEKHMIGPTGVLKLKDRNNTSINGIHVLGRLFIHTDNDLCKSSEYNDSMINDRENPSKITINNQTYDCERDGSLLLVKMPVDLNIEYTYDRQRIEYVKTPTQLLEDTL